MKNILKLISIIILFCVTSANVISAEKVEYLKTDWTFKGLFGKFDRASLQRGYQVYTEVCAACHSMKYLSYRNLSEKGGPEFSVAQAKAIAASFEVTDGPNADGEMFDRPGKLSDKFVMPYENVITFSYGITNLSDSFPGRSNISPSAFGPSVTSNEAAIALAWATENSGPPFSDKFL